MTCVRDTIADVDQKKSNESTKRMLGQGQLEPLISCTEIGRPRQR